MAEDNRGFFGCWGGNAIIWIILIILIILLLFPGA